MVYRYLWRATRRTAARRTTTLLAAMLLATSACEIDSGVATPPGFDTSDPIPDAGEPDASDVGDPGDDPDSADDPQAEPDATSDPDGGEDTGDAVEDGDATEPVDPAVLRPRFDPEADDFYRMPWPSDFRRDADGHPDLSDFPRPSPTLLQRIIAVIQSEADGFASMPVVYVELDQAPSTDAIPAPAETLPVDGPIQLFDVGDDDCGARVPLVVDFDGSGNAYRPPNVLMATPVPGFALVPKHTYAFVVLTEFGDNGGQETATPPRMAELLAGTDQDERLQASYAPLVSCLPSAGIEPADIAVATVFTVQDPVSECRAVRDDVMNPERVRAPTILDLAESDEHSAEGRYTSYVGHYETPIYQRGISPYANTGGGFVFDEAGRPVVQRWEEVPFVITIPHRYDEPVPVLIWSDGTGAGLFHHLGEAPTNDLLAAGFAVITFSPQFHGERAVPGSDPVVHSFNFNNPESGRTVFRQQAIDTSYLIRLIRGPLATSDLLPDLDTSRLVYASHSQGSLVGAIIAGVEPEIRAFAFNGLGAYVSATIEERKDPVDVAALLQAFLGVDDPIDVFHPVVQLIQLGAEPVDALSYARQWRGWPAHPSGSHVYVSNGPNDHTSPRRGIAMVTIVADLAPIDPPGWDIDPYGVWSREPETLPIEANRLALDGSPLTMATWLDDESGHYTIYDVQEARDLAVHFLSTALDGTPTLE